MKHNKDRVLAKLMKGLPKQTTIATIAKYRPLLRPVLVPVPPGFVWTAEGGGLTKPVLFPDMTNSTTWLDDNNVQFIGPVMVDILTMRVHPTYGTLVPVPGYSLTEFLG